MTTEYEDAFDKIILHYCRIGEVLIRFQTLQGTFGQHPEFQQILAIFYSDILEFNGEAYKFVTRNGKLAKQHITLLDKFFLLDSRLIITVIGWQLFFLTSWGRFQRRFDSIIENLRAHEDLLDRTASALNISEARRGRELLQQDRIETLKRITQAEKAQHANMYLEVSAWLKVDDCDQAGIFDRISQEVSKFPGTCEWILQHDRLRVWLRRDSSSSFLWLQGSPGSGKSVLANRIVTFLQASPETLVVRHFCDPLQPGSAHYEFILRSILFQLIRPSEHLVAYVHGLRNEEFLAKTLSPRALEDLIRNVSVAVSSNPSEQHQVHIIIDGLDECDEEKQKRLIWLLERLVNHSDQPNCSYKVLLVSRQSSFLQKRLRHATRVSLGDEVNLVTRSIETYSRQRLGLIRGRLFELGIDDARIKMLASKLAIKADGGTSYYDFLPL